MYRKNLFFYPSALTIPNFEILVNELEERLSKDEDCTIIQCDGSLKYCESNPYGSSYVCKLCKSNFSNKINRLERRFDNLSVVQSSKIISKENQDRIVLENESLIGANIGVIQQMDYLGTNIGYGAFSTYVQRSKNTVLVKENDSRLLQNYLYGARVAVLLGNILVSDNYSRLIIYNGRLHTLRPIYYIFKNQNALVDILEVIDGRNGKPFRRQIYEARTPFSRKDFADCIEDNWQLHDKSERVLIGEKFFSDKFEGVPVLDKSYINDDFIEAEGYLNRRDSLKFVVFNSSPDERASLGEDWEWEFEGESDQSKVVRLILDGLTASGMDFELVFRAHPNMSNYKGSELSTIATYVDKYSSFQYISPDERVNSYSLIQKADLVLTFGSTIGVEAAYMGKKSVVIGKSFYDYLNIAVNVRDVSGILEVAFADHDRQVNEDVLKWGLYYASRRLNVTDNVYCNPLNVQGRTGSKLLIRHFYKIYVRNILISKLVNFLKTYIN